MCLSNCSKCTYLNRSPHHLSDIVCSLNPAYAELSKCLQSLDEYTLNCLPIDECSHFELDPLFENQEISLSLSFSSWQNLARESNNPIIKQALKDISFRLDLSLTLEKWQAIANSNTDPFVRVALEGQGIKPHRDPWVAVDSSCIDSISHNKATSELKIRFNSSDIYQYSNVPYETFLSFLDADSKGRYFHRYIKDIYDFRLL